jgi:selenide, water dikinase
VLSDIPAQTDPRVLIDFRTADDAGVYRWESGPALVQTVDFFTPIVDDPYVYGQIAAANSVSDVYAMGGRPLTALAIAAFPETGLEPDVIREIFKGGFDKLREADVALLGGHTVRDREIKFGYAVTGAIDPERILANGGAQSGDVLYLTKPLGTGIVGTAIKFERAGTTMMEQAIASMRTLNKAAAEALATLPRGAVHACTDITGFGLAGHGTEMAKASGVTLEFDLECLPMFNGVLEVAAENRSGGMTSNEAHFSTGVGVGPMSDPGPTRVRPRNEATQGLPIIYDPQTSGGLLVAVARGSETLADQAFRAAGVTAWKVGRVAAQTVPGIHIHMV